MQGGTFTRFFPVPPCNHLLVTQAKKAIFEKFNKTLEVKFLIIQIKEGRYLKER